MQEKTIEKPSTFRRSSRNVKKGEESEPCHDLHSKYVRSCNRRNGKMNVLKRRSLKKLEIPDKIEVLGFETANAEKATEKDIDTLISDSHPDPLSLSKIKKHSQGGTHDENSDGETEGLPSDNRDDISCFITANESCGAADGIQQNKKVHETEVSNEDKSSSSLKGPPVLVKCTKPICCAFCKSYEQNEASGVMVCYFKGKLLEEYQSEAASAIHLHRSCAEWAPNIYFEGRKVVNLESELSRSRRIKCSSCGLSGAALGCYEKSCRKSFHVPCAKLTPECRWDYENFVMLCPFHSSSQLPCDGHQSQINHGKERFTKRKSSAQQTKNVCGPKIMSQWVSKKFKGIVLCFSGLTNEEKETVNEFERLSGAVILHKWRSSVTHVIASRDDNGACRRTLKFLMGILEGKWVLGVEWIKACIEAGDLVDEHQYEVSLDIHGIRDGPRLGRLRLMNKHPRLFEGVKFFVMNEFAPSYKGFLHDLITAAGGKVLSRKPVAGDDAATTYIVYSIDAPDNCNQSNKSSIHSHAQAKVSTCSTGGALLVSNSWILNSIAGYKLQEIEE